MEPQADSPQNGKHLPLEQIPRRSQIIIINNSNRLLDVNLWTAVTHHHRSRKQRIVLSEFNNLTSFSFVITFTTFALLFHVKSFLFFIGDKRFVFPNWMRSLTNVVYSVCPMVL